MKNLFKVAILGLSLIMAVSFAYAGGGRGFGRVVRDGSGPINKTGTIRPNFVDANGDGICDKKNTHKQKNSPAMIHGSILKRRNLI